MCVHAVLLVGAGRLTSALSLLTSAVSGSSENMIVRYNLALLKVKLAHNSSTLTPQTLTALQRYVPIEVVQVMSQNCKNLLITLVQFFLRVRDITKCSSLKA